MIPASAAVLAAAPASASPVLAVVAVTAAPGPCIASRSSLHVDGMVLALAVVVLLVVGDPVTILDAAVAIRETRYMGEDVLTAVVRLDKAKALLTVPTEHDTRAVAGPAVAARTASAPAAA